jgi:hypothetical protein
MSTVYGMLLGATMPQSGLLLRRYRESVESRLVSAVLFASGVQQLKGRNELKYRAISGNVRQRCQIKRLSTLTDKGESIALQSLRSCVNRPKRIQGGKIHARKPS